MVRVLIIIALYRETEMIEQLLHQIARLRYPKAQLDVLLIIKDDDTATLSALDSHILPNTISVHILPAGPIMTKPRVLNYSLGFYTFDIVVVYDAEDKPTIPRSKQPQSILPLRHRRSPAFRASWIFTTLRATGSPNTLQLNTLFGSD